MKKKWKREEEKALREGVRKYGQGKWINILYDPNFFPLLFHRSNVDLKDKWRTMNDRAKEGAIDLLNEENQSLADDADKIAKSFIIPQTHERQAATRYKKVIVEALLAIKDPKGSEIDDIFKFIEQRYEVPQDFKRSLKAQLSSLVTQGHLEKAKNCYRIKIKEEAATKTPIPKRQRKTRKLRHNPDLVNSSNESLEAEKNDDPKSVKSAEEEDVGVLKQVVQGIYGRCKRAIAWSPFGSTSRTGY